MKHPLLLLGLLLPLTLAGCATPESRIRSALIEAGVAPPVSRCIAKRMADRLSLLQLRRLTALDDLRNRDLKTVPIDMFLRKVRAIGDPEIVSVTTHAAIACALEFG